SVYGTIVGTEVVPDTAVGTTASGVMQDVAAINQTSFVYSWFDSIADVGTFFSTYSTFGVTTPTAIVSNISVLNNSLKYHAVAGYQPSTNIGFCQGNKFVIAFVNTTGFYWKTYFTNGAEWDGICPDLTPPNVTLIYPSNNTLLEQKNVDFNFTVYDKKTLIIPNCSLWANFTGVFQEIATVYNISINTITNITMNDLEDGYYVWNVKCYDGSNNSAFAINNNTLIINFYPPNISNPEINTTTINQSEFIKFNATITDEFGISYAFITIKYPNGTYKNISLVKNNDEYYINFNDTIQLGIYNITFIWANDSFGKSSNQSLNLYFQVVPSPPSEFDLISPYNKTESKNLVPTLTWQQTQEQTFSNYTIQISKDSSFTTIDYAYYTFEITNTSYTVDYALDANSMYYWRVIAYDVFGNYRISTNYFVYITDTISPTITLIYPENNTILSQNQITFKYVPNDANTLNTCALYGNFSGSFSKIVESNNITKGVENNLTTTIVNEGIFAWNVWCNDTATNNGFSTQNYTLMLDFSPPKINLMYPNNNSIENETNIITFIANATDTYSNISFCELIIDGEIKDTNYEITRGVSFNFTVFLQNGNYTWNVNCTDTNGFENSSEIFNLSIFVIDAQPPFITINSPRNNTFLSYDTILINYTPQDSTGIENCSLIMNNAINQTDYEIENFVPNYFTIILEEGIYNFKIGCYDNSSEFNYAETEEYTLIVDLTNPAVLLEFPENNSYSRSEVSFAYTPIDLNLDSCILYGNFSGIWEEQAYDNSPINNNSNEFSRTLNDSIFVWNVWCNDSSGRNSFASENFTIKVDSTSPFYYNNISYPETPTTYEPNKEYYFIINWSDNFGIKELVIEQNFTGQILNITLINLSIENESQSNSTISYNYSLQNLNASIYYYKWYVTDFNNNTNSTPKYDYVVEKSDSEIKLKLNGVENNITIDEDNYVNISAEVIKPITGYLEIYVNNDLIAFGNSPLSINYFFEDPGIYNITAIYNQTNNYKLSYATYFLTTNDITPPNINLTQPSQSALIGYATINFNYIVYDKSNLSNCSLIINSTINKTNYNVSVGEVNTFTQIFEEGNYSWKVECYDIFGNYNISEERNFTYIKSDKIIGYAQTSKPQYQKGEPAILIANTTDIFGSPLITNVTKADVIFGNTTVDWWNTSWIYRKQIFINNSFRAPIYKTIDLNISGISTYINSCEELRIVQTNGFNHTLIPSQIVSNSSKTWCVIRFNANLTKLGLNDNYWLHYGNPNASSTGQTVSLAGLKIQRNWYSMTTTSATINIEPVNVNNAFVMLTVNIASSLPSRSEITARISASNQLLFERYAAVTTANISWQVVESSEISVQRATVSFATTQLNATINLNNEVNLNESFIIVLGRANSGTAGNNNQGFFRAMFLNSTTVYVERATSGSAAIAELQIIQWSGARVQSGNFSFSTLEYNISVGSVNLSRAFLIFGTAVSGVSTIDGNYIRGNITNQTILRFYKETTSGTAYISWFLVEMPEEFDVQKNSSQITADANIAINPVVMQKAFHVQSWSATTATTTYTNGFMRFELQSPTNFWADVVAGTNTKKIVSFIVEEKSLNVTLGVQQEFKKESSGETDIYGIFTFDWSTKNQSLGTYSLVFIAEKENFTTTRAYNTFEIIPDTTKPTVTLLLPEDNYTTGVGYINLSYIPFDYNLANCTLYIGNEYSFNPNVTNSSPLNNETNYFNNVFFRVGIYYWNVKCEDTEGNFGFATQNFTLNISGPDLVITPERIFFNETNSSEGSNITVFANITNLGLSDADKPFIVQFYYGDPDLGGTQLNSNITVPNLSRNNFIIVNTTFIVKPGNNNIFAVLDPNNIVNESDETNNKANKSISIPIYQYYYGNISVEIMLGDYLNKTLLKVESSETNYGNIIISDVDSSFSFNDLIPLTRNINNQKTNNDFTDLDIILNTSDANDSIKNTWGLGTDDPIAIATFNISGRIIDNVPIINSTNNPNFITGILWDKADDLSNNYQFDYNNKEDIVFVTKINPKKQGAYGIYDYEIRIPSLLKNYKSGTSLVNFYVEII
ncbi:MAG: CARDB domain-containing protein, partial [Candidatus Woesearchaeota archaeon]